MLDIISDAIFDSKLIRLAITTYFLSKLSSTVNYYVKYGVFMLTAFISVSLMLPYMILRGVPHSKHMILPSIITIKVCEWLGLTCTLLGVENVKAGSGSTFLLNHQSSLDTVVCSQLLVNVCSNMGVLVKKQVKFLFPFGAAAGMAGAIFIDRKNRNSAIQTLGAEVEKLKNGTKMLIFPEGTRNTSEVLLPFKKGAFYLAVDTQTPIQPVIISHYDHIHHEKKLFGRGKIIIKILPEISTQGLRRDDVRSLVERVQHIMQTEITNLNDEIRKNKSI